MYLNSPIFSFCLLTEVSPDPSFSSHPLRSHPRSPAFSKHEKSCGSTSCCIPLPARALFLAPLLVDETFSLPNTSLYPSTTLEELIKEFICIHLDPLLLLFPARPLSQTPNIPSLVSQPNIFIFSFGKALFWIEITLHQRLLLIQLINPENWLIFTMAATTKELVGVFTFV